MAVAFGLRDLAIQSTSRDALEDMRRMLGVLRQQDSVLGREWPRFAPLASARCPPAKRSGPNAYGAPTNGGEVCWQTAPAGGSAPVVR